jgi:hypothetical protein
VRAELERELSARLHAVLALRPELGLERSDVDARLAALLTDLLPSAPR